MSDFNKIEKNNINVLSPFKLLVLQNFPFIEADFDAITNYQLMCKMAEYMNDINSNVNTLNENENRVYNAFNELVDYINNYFDNLDVQEEINNKLDDMAEDGTLTELIRNYVDPLLANTNSIVERLENDVTSLKSSYGSPLTANSSSDMTDTNKIYVYTGVTNSNFTNGNWYYYNGTNWVSGGVYNSSVVGNNSIYERNLNTNFNNDLKNSAYRVIFKSSNNLVYEPDVKVGFYQYSSNVLTYFNNSSYYSIILPVKPSTTYFINKLVHWYYAADENLNQIRSYGSSGIDSENVIITTPENTKYLIVNFRSSWGLNNIVIVEGETTDTVYTNKFINPNYLSSNQCIFGRGATHKFKIENGTITIPAGFIIYRNQSYVVNETILTLDSSLPDNVNVVVFNTITKTFRIIGWKEINNENKWSNVTNKFNVEDCIVCIVYGDRYLMVNGCEYDNITINPKSVAFMGDSITAGNNCTKAYHMYLSDVTQLHCLNYGCGGTGFVTETSSNTGKVGNGMEGVPASPVQQHGDNSIGKIIDTVPENITNFVIFGGTNDYGNNVPMTDFENAVQGVIDKLYNRNANMLFLTPIRRFYHSINGETPNTVGLKLSDYVNKIIELCNQNGVPYVDLYNNTGLNPNNSSNKSRNYSDGLHPNNTGHKVIAEKVITPFENYFKIY